MGSKTHLSDSYTDMVQDVAARYVHEQPVAAACSTAHVAVCNTYEDGPTLSYLLEAFVQIIRSITINMGLAKVLHESRRHYQENIVALHAIASHCDRH